MMEACKGGGGWDPMFVNSPIDLQNAQKPHKTNTVCRPALHENQQIFGLLTMNQPQLARAFTKNVEKTNNRTSFCRGKKKIHNLPVDQCFKVHCLWEQFFIKKMKLFLPSHGNLLPEIEQGKPKKVPKFQEFLFSLWGQMWHKMPFFVSTGLWIPTFMFCVLCFCLCKTA